MKKIILALASISFFWGCSNEKLAKNTIEISGNIKGLKKGTIYIQRVQDSTIINLDTLIFNGQSTFKSTFKLDQPEMLYMFLDRGTSRSEDNNLLFFAEPTKMTINSELDNFFAMTKVTGSKNHELYEEYKNIISKFNDQKLELIKNKITQIKTKKTISNSEYQQKEDAILKRRYFYAANFAKTHANKTLSPYIVITDIYDMNLKYLLEIQKAMTPEILNSKYGKKCSEYLKKTSSRRHIKYYFYFLEANRFGISKNYIPI